MGGSIFRLLVFAALCGVGFALPMSRLAVPWLQKPILMGLTSEYLEDFLKRQSSDPELLFHFYSAHKAYKGVYSPSCASCRLEGVAFPLWFLVVRAQP